MKGVVSPPATAAPSAHPPLIFSLHRDKCNIIFFPPPPPQISVLKIHHLQILSPFISLSSSSSSSIPSVTEEQVEVEEEEESFSSSIVESILGDNDGVGISSGCKGCGREQTERGCNGEGRIQGGIATIPGFGWWPIKAYRPCPGFLASGGNYRRRGQSMDEVAFGGGKRGTSKDDLD